LRRMPQEQPVINIGLDIGSISLKLAAVGRREDAAAFDTLLAKGKSFVALPPPLAGGLEGPAALSHYRRIHYSPIQSAFDLLKEFYDLVPESQVEGIRVTGAASPLIARILGIYLENEFKAIARAVALFYPEVRTVFEMGGASSKYLLLDPVATHVITQLARAIMAAEVTRIEGETVVNHRYLSEVAKLSMRETFSVEVVKCIYPRLPYPSQSGNLEKNFILWADADSTVDAFCKINEQRHHFTRLRYLKDDGLPAFYSPDFIVRSKDCIYLVETKAKGQISHPNVQRKKMAAVNWCANINRLPAEKRADRVHIAI